MLVNLVSLVNYWAISLVIFVVCLLLNLSMLQMHRELLAEYRKVLGDTWCAGSVWFAVTVLCAGINACIPYIRWVYLGWMILCGIAFAFPKLRAAYIRFFFKPFYEFNKAI
jgi:hypothetical protein